MSAGEVEAAACRVDVWLWRARFFKTRALACRFAEDGRVRLTRHGVQTRLDKASRLVRPGDRLVFVLGGRVTALEIAALGERRGPATEARKLYATFSETGTPIDSIAASTDGLRSGAEPGGHAPFLSRPTTAAKRIEP